MELKPSRQLEKLLQNSNTGLAGIPHWLSFGGLCGMIADRGIIYDGDLDWCTFYGQDYESISRSMTSAGFTVKKVLLFGDKAIYMGFSHPVAHVCLSFWYRWKHLCFYCHDQSNEVPSGIGVPASGYYFKGVPSYLVDYFYDAEYPGIPQATKVRVPVLAGALLDHCYPAWCYHKQRHVIRDYQVEEDRQIFINNPVYNKSAISFEKGYVRPYRVHVMSPDEFKDENLIYKQLEQSETEWKSYMGKRFN